MTVMNKRERAQHRMANAKMSTLVFFYSLPTIIGMLINALYNVVDRFWVGQIPEVGQSALTGIGLCMPLMNITLGLSMLVAIGATARISIILGQKNHTGAEQILGCALSLILVIGFVYTFVCLIFTRPILQAIGATDVTMPYALPYMRIILAGCLFQLTSFAMNHPIRGAGNPLRFAMTQAVGGILNMILDPLLIFTFDMGFRGAAVATIISQAVSAAFVFSYYFSGKSPLRLRLCYMRPRLTTAIQIFSIGLSPFLMQVANSLINIVLNLSLLHYGREAFGNGDVAIGAMTVISSISTLFLMPIFGINQGAQPIIGYNFGAGNIARVKLANFWAVVYALVITTIGFIITRLYAAQLVALFNDSPLLVQIGSRGMQIVLCTLPIVGFQIPLQNFFTAIGRARISIFLSLLRQVILLIPAFLLLPLFLGFDGIWFAVPLADCLALCITLAFVFREYRLLNAHTQDDLQQDQNPDQNLAKQETERTIQHARS